MSKEDCHTCGEEFEDNCEFCSFAYPFCSLECYDKYDEGAAMDNERISEIVEEEMIKQDANRYRDMRKILTIPKSIADELDDIFNEFVRIKNSRSIWGLLWRAEEIDEETRMRLVWLLPDENQVNIAIAYLTGKALGVDLVKVVEA